MKRSESAPTLAPVWEPPVAAGDAGADEEEQPAWMSSAHSFSDARAVSAASFAELLAPRFSDDALPAPWEKLLGQLSSDALSSPGSVSQIELVAAAQDSLQSGSLPLLLQRGLVDEYYTMRRELSRGRGYKIMEGVEKATQRNFSLKIVSTCGRARLPREPKPAKPLDPMQAFYLVSSFVEEAYLHPAFVVLVMKWGMHEVDAAHQVSRWVVDSLSLLRELLPQPQRDRCYLRFPARELQRVLLRSSCLDLFLQTHLFIQ